jgi:CheY-like chemotaxis protein
MRRALRLTLERAGFAVAEAKSASEALDYLGQKRPADAVVSDVLMPELSGLDFYDRLMRQAPHLTGRMVFLTGAARNPTVHGSIEQRGVPLISKLDDLRLVVDAVRVALLRRDQPVQDQP